VKRRISSKSQTIFSTESTIHNTEWTCAAILAKWIDETAKEKNIPIGSAVVETTTELSRKRSAILIYESPRNISVLCVIECKQPFWDVFEEGLIDDARRKGNRRKAPYFGTCNFKKLIWWNTERANNPTLTEEQQILEKYSLSEIENLDEIENIRFREPIRRELEKFIRKLYAVHTGKEPEPKQAIDEFLIDRIHEKIRVLAFFYTGIIRDLFHKDTKFAKSLKNWFDEQMWDFQGTQNDFNKAARQTAYLLVNKILFYDVLQSKRPKELSQLDIPKGMMQSSLLRKMLKMYFDEVLEIDYETVYTTDFIDVIAFPDDEEVVKQIKELIYVLNRYRFDTIGYDIIGRIFERLIPYEERHTLGQYFTSADVVDLILRFCSHNEDDKLLDPSCGAGTFLVRAYQHKKLMNQNKQHEEILDKLWGNDIAKFPAHLSTINLAINDLGVLKNYPNIMQSDFFALGVSPEGGAEFGGWRTRRSKTLGLEEREISYPRYFDAIVGNPPYTRQEEIEDTGVEKSKLVENAVKFGNIKIANLTKRAGIHAYFFVHGWKFLKEGGHFGFIVSNSWMDVDYGKGLQEFFLRNYKIVAIIESKVERWFADADVNTCIVILEKFSDEKERMKNLARFVYLKKPLRHFIPATENEWSKQVERKDEIDKLIQTVLAHSKYYENDDLRVFPISQKELWEEGYDKNEKIFTGAKWGKYIRAPRIFFTILRKGKNKLVPLKEVADVRFGIKTGANEFFYLNEKEIKRKKIEKEFWMHKDEKGEWVPNYVIKTSRECEFLIVKAEDLKYRILMIRKQKKKLKRTKILQYILAGERKKFHERPTCASRGEMWYLLPEISAPILSKRFVDVAFGYFLNPEKFYVGDTFFVINPYKTNHTEKVAAFLNSTLGAFFTEIYGRTLMGEGVLLIYGPEIVPMPILKPELLFDGRTKFIQKFLKGKVNSVFDELGAKNPSDVLLSKVKPDRRELDKIIMGEILGLTDGEQLDVYRAVVDLVKSRIEKAKSIEKKQKFVEGIDMELATRDVIYGLKNKVK
jgi:adenine-specific DNA methylase